MQMTTDVDNTPTTTSYSSATDYVNGEMDCSSTVRTDVLAYSYVLNIYP